MRVTKLNSACSGDPERCEWKATLKPNSNDFHFLQTDWPGLRFKHSPYLHAELICTCSSQWYHMNPTTVSEVNTFLHTVKSYQMPSTIQSTCTAKVGFSAPPPKKLTKNLLGQGEDGHSESSYHFYPQPIAHLCKAPLSLPQQSYNQGLSLILLILQHS